MSERHHSFLHQWANGELDDEERDYVVAELYGSGLFDGAVSWNTEGRSARNVPVLPVTRSSHHKDAHGAGSDAEKPFFGRNPG